MLKSWFNFIPTDYYQNQYTWDSSSRGDVFWWRWVADPMSSSLSIFQVLIHLVADVVLRAIQLKQRQLRTWNHPQEKTETWELLFSLKETVNGFSWLNSSSQTEENFEVILEDRHFKSSPPNKNLNYGSLRHCCLPHTSFYPSICLCNSITYVHLHDTSVYRPDGSRRIFKMRVSKLGSFLRV